MVKMKQKNVSFLIAFLLFSSMTFSMIVSVKADYSYDYTGTYFDYNVAEGDILEYNLNYNFNFSAESTFYDGVDDWIENQTDTMGVSIGNFSLETFISDLEVFLELDYKLKFEITEMYQKISEDINTDGSYSTRYDDIINASIRADINEGDGWQTPEVVSIDKLK